MVKSVFFIHSCKDHGEFFPAIAECLTAASHLRDARRYHLQHLVTNIVPVGVIELFEVIDVQHRQAVGAAKGIKQLIKGAAVGQAGQFISIGHVVRIANDVGTHIQAAGHQENFPTMFDR